MSDRDDETGEICCSCGDYIHIEKMCMCEEIIRLRARVEELEAELNPRPRRTPDGMGG